MDINSTEGIEATEEINLEEKCHIEESGEKDAQASFGITAERPLHKSLTLL